VSHFTALFDACVLFPAQLRSLLMYLALTGLFRAKWTDEIHEEWMRGVLEKYPDRTRAEIERVRDLMNAHVPDCLVTNYSALIPTLQLPDPNDRHVLAAAIRGRADVIVTNNLSDFPAETLAMFGIEAQHPDQFIAHLLDLAPTAVCTAAKRQRESLKNPPKTVGEYLGTLEAAGLPQTVAGLKQFAALI
jgi:predicted nucleic acid-binding protein